MTMSAFDPPCVKPAHRQPYQGRNSKKVIRTFAKAHPTIRQLPLMPIDIQQTPHHQRLTVRIQQRNQRMDTPETIPDAIVAIIVRLAGRTPIWVLTRIILRTDHTAIHAAPERALQHIARTPRLDANHVEFIAPSLLGRLKRTVEIELGDLALRIRTCLRFADEAHPHARGNLIVTIRLLELHPTPRRSYTRTTLRLSPKHPEELCLSRGARVRKHAAALQARAMEISAEVAHIRADSETGYEASAAREPPIRPDFDGAVAARLRKVLELEHDERV